ncbi:retrovirus-related Pol polyprotein from type-1 retrotransposable element R2 [Trichonephila inaurata madagascariensis]|uniref:Retrovirus-related Pol polyprotein from type-1 retrotransposable element R2 n=1 Tax=Trichonephila inaurata madagascariensis TaxID=2747483 RepID=A0A8X7C848_9ARAC|nr:retrovirus-related Pol polyprotein from type-1 retrotransposable element R2 [Trichonephila inaurata madagascariensis]
MTACWNTACLLTQHLEAARRCDTVVSTRGVAGHLSGRLRFCPKAEVVTDSPRRLWGGQNFVSPNMQHLSGVCCLRVLTEEDKPLYPAAHLNFLRSVLLFTSREGFPLALYLRSSNWKALRSKLCDGDSYTYLGTPVGFFVQKNFKTANQALTILEKISTSHLAQWQKLDALKTFFPTLSFSMRTCQLGKTDWSEVDVAARTEIKSILSLPSSASNHYIYGNRKLGGCGVPSAAEDSDFYLVDSAFKLLTSRDEDVSFEALGQLTRTVAHRIGRQPSDGDLGAYMSGSMEGEYAETTNQLSNTWTLARKASTRQQVTWSFTEGKPTVTIGDEVLTSTKRRSILKAFHDNFQVRETQNLLAAPSQGKVMDCVAMGPPAHISSTMENTPGLPTGGSFTKPASTWSPSMPTRRGHCQHCERVGNAASGMRHSHTS